MKRKAGRGLFITGIVLVVLGGLGMLGLFTPPEAGQPDTRAANAVVYALFIAGGVLLIRRGQRKMRQPPPPMMPMQPPQPMMPPQPMQQTQQTFTTTYTRTNAQRTQVVNAPMTEEYARELQQNLKAIAAAMRGETPAQAPEAVVVTATCDACGGHNKAAIGQVVACAYCGAPVKAT